MSYIPELTIFIQLLKAKKDRNKERTSELEKMIENDEVLRIIFFLQYKQATKDEQQIIIMGSNINFSGV